MLGGCVSDAAYVKASAAQGKVILKQAIVDTAIQVGLALWQRNAKESISQMQNEIADRQMKLAEALQEHAKKFWPPEEALITDAFNEQKVTENYVAAASGWGGIAQKAVADGRAGWVLEARRTCSTPSVCEDARFQRNGVAIRTDITAFALRTEEARKDAFNDRRYERQYKLLGLGRGLIANVIGFQGNFLAAGGTATRLLESAVNTARSMYGYSSTRRDPLQGGYGAQIEATLLAPYKPENQKLIYESLPDGRTA
jgi:hypothetical protein